MTAPAPWFLKATHEPAPYLAGGSSRAARPLFPALVPAPAPSPPPAPAAVAPSPSPSPAPMATKTTTMTTTTPTTTPAPKPTETLPSAFVAAAASLEALQAEMLQTARAEVLELALQLARRIVGEAVDRGDVDVTAWLDEAMTRLGDGSRATVRVHPTQRALIDRWISSVAPDAVQVVFDDGLGPGDVVVESAAGVVDGRVATRLARVEAAARRSMGDAR